MVDEALRALERAAGQGDPEAKARLERLRVRAGLLEGSAAVEAELAALLAADAAAEAALRQVGVAAFRRWVEAVFAAEPGLQVAVVRGYTPGFADGDACEHGQYAVFGEGDGPEFEEPEGGISGWFGRKRRLNTIARERAREHEQHAALFTRALHLEHGTDWQLTLRRTPAGVTIERSDFHEAD